MRQKKPFIILFVIILFGILSWDELSRLKLFASPSLREIAEYWSPVIYQSTAGTYDYITNFDFDGNWVGYDNWENWQCYSKPCYVYYSIIESTNHYWITYNFFHPRDVGNPAWGNAYAHENDLEGCRFVILKDGSQWGRLGWVETQAHYFNEVYQSFDINTEGSHPIVYVCPYKHAVYGTNVATQSWDCDYLGPGCRVFPSAQGTGVIYRYKGYAQEPIGLNDRDVGYYLVPLENTIWAKRFEFPTFNNCSSFIKDFYKLSSDPNNCGVVIQTAQFGANFSGDNGRKCDAKPPWNYDFDSNGKWFIEPLLTYHTPDNRPLFCAGERYIYNPFENSMSWCPPSCSNEYAPECCYGLEVKKSVDRTQINPNESVTYRYEIKNIGKYLSTGINVNDDKLGIIGNKSMLYPNETWTLEQTTVLNQTTTNQAYATCFFHVWCTEIYRTYFSNLITVEVIAPPPPPEEPPPPPEEPPLPPEPLPEAQVVMYWDREHSFTQNEHSLSNWTLGKTADAHINKNGCLEINIDPLEYPNVISSPDLKALLPGMRFDAIEMLYINQANNPKGTSQGAIGWLDETLFDEKGRLKRKEEYGKSGKRVIKFPLDKSSNYKWKLVVLKDKLNWESDKQAIVLTFTPSYLENMTEGKFMIRAIKLIKIN